MPPCNLPSPPSHATKPLQWLKTSESSITTSTTQRPQQQQQQRFLLQYQPPQYPLPSPGLSLCLTWAFLSHFPLLGGDGDIAALWLRREAAAAACQREFPPRQLLLPSGNGNACSFCFWCCWVSSIFRLYWVFFRWSGLCFGCCGLGGLGSATAEFHCWGWVLDFRIWVAVLCPCCICTFVGLIWGRLSASAPLFLSLFQFQLNFGFVYFFLDFGVFCGWCFVFLGGRVRWCIGGVIGWVDILFAPFDSVVELRFWVCFFRVCGFASRISGCR